MREFRAALPKTIIKPPHGGTSIGRMMFILQRSSRNLGRLCQKTLRRQFIFPLICHQYILNIFYIVCLFGGCGHSTRLESVFSTESHINALMCTGPFIWITITCTRPSDIVREDTSGSAQDTCPWFPPQSSLVWLFGLA